LVSKFNKSHTYDTISSVDKNIYKTCPAFEVCELYDPFFIDENRTIMDFATFSLPV